MLISAKNYWTKLLPMCIKKTCIIPKEFYYLLTSLKTLQAKIDKCVIEEFISDPDRLKELIEEITWGKNIRHREEYYITSSYNTDEIEDIIKKVFKVTYIDDDYIKINKLINKN